MQNHKVSILGEMLKKITLNLPVRRAQTANWGLRLLNIKEPFIGNFLGHAIEIRPLEAASRAAYFTGFYERETTLWALDYFRKYKPKVIFDVGANFGYFAYLAFSELDSAQIYCFEPDPMNLLWLKDNIRLAQSTNQVTLCGAAVSNEKGTVRFMPTTGNNMNQSLWAGINFKPLLSSPSEIEAPSISLDDFCEEQKISYVDLIKMDIEGAEGFAVEGMKRGIGKRMYNNVLVELHPHMLSEAHAPAKLVEKFLSAGYNAYHFQSPFTDEKNADKATGFYNMEWKSSYMKKVDAKSFDGKLTTWEHVLFSVNSYS